MTLALEEAIKILKDHHEVILVYKNPDLRAAVRLGIEALERVKSQRADKRFMASMPLPGETEE